MLYEMQVQETEIIDRGDILQIFDAMAVGTWSLLKGLPLVLFVVLQFCW